MLRGVAASVTVVAVALAAVAFVTDVPLLRLHDLSARTIVATAAVDGALAFFCALAAAPVWTAIVAILRRLRRSRSLLGRLWLVAVMAVGFATSLLLTDAFYRPHTAPYLICAAGFCLALAALALVATLEHERLRLLLLCAIGGAALTADLSMSQAVSRGVRDVIALIAAGAAVTALEPVRRRLVGANGYKLLAAIVVALAGSTAVVYAADPWAPGWRPQAWEAARWQPRLGRALRALVDFDGDGFSPVAWGGDCDDFDPARNPVRHDHDGIDANCNGTVKPLHASDADRGLAPPAGNPDEPAGAVDRVLLITIDTFRADAFTPEVAPRLSALAKQGIDFSRLYSAASSTLQSLTLVLRGTDEAPPVGERLLRSGVNTSALFAYHDQRLQATFFPGFAVSHAPTEAELRWSARELTDRAMAHISTAGPRRELLWIHYFDAHYPVTPAPDMTPISPPRGRPAEVGPYLTALATIDREIGRLQDWLMATDRWSRTLVIITADHGESFGEHGVAYHGIGTYESVVHVPGILVGPGVTPLRYSKVVSHRDLPATILGGFGLVARDPSVEEFGRSWLRLDAAPAAPLHHFVVTRSDRAEAGLDTRKMPMAAIVDDELKLLVTFAIDLKELYAPLDDPRERRDLFASMSGPAGRLDRQLALYCDIDGYP